MNIAIVVNSLKMGGMERVACNLSDAFAKQGHNTHLIYLKDRKVEVAPDDIRVQVHLFSLQKMAILSGIGSIWLLVCRLLNIFLRKSFLLFFAYAEAVTFSYKLKQLEKKSGRFDLIIFRGQGTFSHIRPLKDPRFVFVCESMQNKMHYGYRSKKMFSWLFSNRKMVCVSEEVKESLIDLVEYHYIACKSIEVISNPNDYEKILKNAAVQDDHIDLQPKPYILGLGRLVSGKNFPLLIDAYQYAREHFGIKQDLVIVGEGRERASIDKKIQQLGLGKLRLRIRIVPRMPNLVKNHKKSLTSVLLALKQAHSALFKGF